MTLLTRNARIAATRPNWRDPVRVEYEFQTEVFTSRDGTEQRWATRQQPRVSIQFTTLLDREKLARHRADMVSGLQIPLAVRAEWSRVALAAEALAGASTVDLTAAPAWALPGNMMILTSGTAEELVEIASVSGATVTLAAPLTGDFPAGARVVRAYMANLGDRADFQAESDSVWVGNMRYSAVPGLNTEPVPGVDLDRFEMREVFLTKPNWRTQPRLEFIQEQEEFDPGFGRTEITSPELSGHLRTRLGFTAVSSDRADSIIGLFMRMKGRRGSFWMPTWSRDIIPSATALAGANQFQVDGADFRTAYADNPVFQVMIAFWPDGTYQINRVASIAGTTDSEITFADNWLNAITPAAKIMWLTLSRFDGDALEVRWQTDGVAEIAFNVKTLYTSEFGLPDNPVGPYDPVLGVSDPALDFINLVRTSGAGMPQMVAWGRAPLTKQTAYEFGEVIDILDLGFTPEEIAAGAVKAGCVAVGSTTVTSTGLPAEVALGIEIRFHSTYPVAFNEIGIVAAGEPVVFSDLNPGSSFEQGLGLAKVPAGTRYVRFRPTSSIGATRTIASDRSFWVLTK
ncbi:tail tape measure protein [Ruegeria phage vB_RpoS-V16]|uniref:tail assembly protein n=1 Tax=Ruegeria phage vB_RpoS-V16 TaxID=2218618 RepID=UPI000DCACBB8|nr:tail assembly protein [Ruegeria phage vB_RpoS-V16]AWY09486.1 tail tape measure protein [Ruegeria phage vB_RpoS-V16]